MLNQFSRTQLLFGEEAMRKLAVSRVALFGLGGVGGYAAEALARSGVGALDLIDGDKITVTNINRQILATLNTVGKYKVDVARERIAEINPDCKVKTFKIFYLPSNEKEVDFSLYDYVVDAIDTVSGKLEIIKNAKAADVPVISSMGAGNKLDPTAFEVADIYKTSVCPLAKIMRRELRKMGIDSLKSVYSKEEPLKPQKGNVNFADNPTDSTENCAVRREIPGSNAFIPPVAGLIIASEVIKDLIGL